jgi:hypothetical protein
MKGGRNRYTATNCLSFLRKNVPIRAGWERLEVALLEPSSLFACLTMVLLCFSAPEVASEPLASRVFPRSRRLAVFAP